MTINELSRESQVAESGWADSRTDVCDISRKTLFNLKQKSVGIIYIIPEKLNYVWNINMPFHNHYVRG